MNEKLNFMDDLLISWKAKGIMVYLTSGRTVEEAMEGSNDGTSSFKSGMNELKKRGYVERLRERNEMGTFIWKTVLHESIER